MERFQSQKALADFNDNQRLAGKSIGFSPTMGALHEGHLSLLARSRQDCDISVASIFVNPTQFDRAEDLEKYPRTVEEDCAMLEHAGCDAVFLPSVKEIYPEGAEVTDKYDFGGLEERMEGAHRPGHFAGVAQVVKLLLEAVNPDKLFMGQKDYQQFLICRKLVELESMSVEVLACPIVREQSGLAMSSRNRRLSPDGLEKAVALSRSLIRARKAAVLLGPNELALASMAWLGKAPGLKPEYFEAVHPYTLQPIGNWIEAEPGQPRGVCCAAAWVEGIRLIDNVLILA